MDPHINSEIRREDGAHNDENDIGESLFINDDEVDQQTADLLQQQQQQHTSTQPVNGATSSIATDELPEEPPIEFKSVTFTAPLSFQRKILRNLLDDDVLLVLGRGLGMSVITANLLYALDIAGTQRHPLTGIRLGSENLVFLIGARDEEIHKITEDMWEVSEQDANSNHKRRGITVLTTDKMTKERRSETYAQGGVFCVTSRILIGDFLSGVIDSTKVTGIVCLNAHRVSENSTEAFILTYFRQHSKNGFVKALSDEPEGFLSGFAPLASKMKYLGVRKVVLWPRFHLDVTDSLVFADGRKRRPDENNQVIELHIEMTPHMLGIQTAIIDCLESCLSQLKRTNAGLDTESWTVDEALTKKNFIARVRLQLEPLWHRLSWRARQLVTDIKDLTDLAHALPACDAVTFFFIVENLWVSNSSGDRRIWMMTDSADDLYRLARERVYPHGRKEQIKQNIEAPIEEPPKWYHMAHVLDEISHTRATSGPTNAGCTLILCEKRSTVRQLHRYMSTMDYKNGTFSGQKCLKRYLKESETLVSGFQKVKEAFQTGSASTTSSTSKAPEPRQRPGKPDRLNKRRRVRGGGAVSGRIEGTAASEETPMDEVSHDEEDKDEDMEIVDYIINEEENELVIDSEVKADPITNGLRVIDDSDLVLIQTYNESTLEELRPSFVIMYEPNVAFFRRLEVLRASNRQRSIKVFLLFYGSSLEEQKFLGELGQEKDAFTRLIRERAQMPVYLDTEDDSRKERNSILKAVSSRIAGGGLRASSGLDTDPQVIVDTRELRSSLPFLLYRGGMKVVPVQLTVGDYIVTPDICVERKSISDLVSSFRDGRLYNQCESMFRYYDQPVLLIEFDEKKSFSLTPFSDTPGGAASADATHFVEDTIQQKLAILLLTYPRLKIIWSSSAAQSADIFAELKRGVSEPDPEKSARFGLGENEHASVFNHSSVDMLRAIPGVTHKNSYLIMAKVKNIKELCTMPVEDLAEIVGQEPAIVIKKFLTRKPKAIN